jgi:ATP-dependent helicase/nuclease subunit A
VPEISSQCEPSLTKPALLHRLPHGFRVAQSELSATGPDAALVGAGRLYERHEGGLISRALGSAVHMLLERLAQVFTTQPLTAGVAALMQSEPRIAAAIRATGVAPSESNRIAGEAIAIALRAANDPVGQWILAPHAEAISEVRWTGVVSGTLRTVQVDRVFRAGPAPESGGQPTADNTWWIIDYKTAHKNGLDPEAALPELRKIFAAQVEVYAKVLRNLKGADIALRGGLYYPRMSRLDWWEL